MDNKDIFEILGINSREDSYTELIKYAFDNNIEFKDNFCVLFAGYTSDDFKLSIRCKEIYITVSKKTIEVPDMILYSKNKKEIILIENKIFSGEGYEQTNRYSASPFIEAVKSHFEMSDAQFDKFYFITLDGKKAKSNKFEPMSWSKMILKCCNNAVFQEKRLKLLMSDIIEKSNHYMNFEKPNKDTIFKSYFDNCKKWVTELRAFEVAFENSCKDISRKYNVKYTFDSQNNKNGNQFLIVFNNHQWTKYNLEEVIIDNLTEEEQDKYGNCRNVHLELNWTESSNKISLFIHYETNPYQTRKQLEILPEILRKTYYLNKEKFKQDVYKNMPNDWTKVGRFLTIIKTDIKINQDTKFDTIYNWLEINFQKGFDCIQENLT